MGCEKTCQNPYYSTKHIRELGINGKYWSSRINYKKDPKPACHSSKKDTKPASVDIILYDFRGGHGKDSLLKVEYFKHTCCGKKKWHEETVRLEPQERHGLASPYAPVVWQQLINLYINEHLHINDSCGSDGKISLVDGLKVNPICGLAVPII